MSELSEQELLDLVNEQVPAGLFVVNDSGVWCPYCNHHVDAPWTIEDNLDRKGSYARTCCPSCGWDGEAPDYA